MTIIFNLEENYFVVKINNLSFCWFPYLWPREQAPPAGGKREQLVLSSHTFLEVLEITCAPHWTSQPKGMACLNCKGHCRPPRAWLRRSWRKSHTTQTRQSERRLLVQPFHARHGAREEVEPVRRVRRQRAVADIERRQQRTDRLRAPCRLHVCCLLLISQPKCVTILGRNDLVCCNVSWIH